MCIKLNINNKYYNISNVYRLPNHRAANIIQFLNSLNVHLNTIKNKQSIITGDFNIGTIEEENTHTQMYLNLTHSNGFFIVNKNTITREAAKTELDHIQTNNFENTIQLYYAPYDSLDHRIIFIEYETIDLPITKLKSQNINICTIKPNYLRIPIWLWICKQ